MSFIKKLTTPLLLSTTLSVIPLSYFAPAYAGPLDEYKGSYLDPNANSTPPCDDIVQPSTSEGKRTSDIEGSEAYNSNSVDKQNNSTSQSSSTKGGGGINLGPIGVKGGGEHNSSGSNSNTSEAVRNNSSQTSSVDRGSVEFSTSTPVAAGKSCASLNAASAERDKAAFNADAAVKKAQIDGTTQVEITKTTTAAQVEMVKDTNESKVRATELQVNGEFVSHLLKW